MTLWLLSVALLLLQLTVVPATDDTPFTIVVKNSLTPTPPKSYRTYVVQGGILLGGMRRLRDKNFKFTYTENPDYGPFLKSVNGVDGCTQEHTYWHLLVIKRNESKPIPLVKGIGCYIPNDYDTIILNYTRY